MPGEILRVSSLTASTPITIWLNPHEAIELSVKDILRWIAPTAPESEAFRFLLTCRAARVDPFLKEAHLIGFDTKQGMQWVTVIDKSGWLRRAEEHPAYDGIESGVIILSKDGNVTDTEGAWVPPDHGCIGGWARVHRKDRRVPTSARVGSEYRKNTPNWQLQLPTMYRKTALVAALRESGLCFGFNGSYDREEMPPAGTTQGGALPPPVVVPEDVQAQYNNIPMPSLSADLASDLWNSIAILGMDQTQVNAMLLRRGVASIPELTDHQAQEILFKLHARIDQLKVGEILLPDKPDDAPAEGVTPDLAPNEGISPEAEEQLYKDSIAKLDLAPEDDTSDDDANDPDQPADEEDSDQHDGAADFGLPDNSPLPADLPDAIRPDRPTAKKSRKKSTARS